MLRRSARVAHPWVMSFITWHHAPLQGRLCEVCLVRHWARMSCSCSGTYWMMLVLERFWPVWWKLLVRRSPTCSATCSVLVATAFVLHLQLGVALCQGGLPGRVVGSLAPAPLAQALLGSALCCGYIFCFSSLFSFFSLFNVLQSVGVSWSC